MKNKSFLKQFLLTAPLVLVLVCIQLTTQAQHGYRHGYYSPVYRPYPYYGQTVVRIGGPIVPYGGIPYRYYGGYFYRPYGSYFQIVAPPIGITIGALPYGYYPFSYGPGMFFYFNGIFYRQQNDKKYQVVDAPMGAEVPSLPKGAKTVVINDETFYELGGTYYKAFTKSDNKTWYKVVGKNGVVNNSAEPAQTAPPAAPRIGDKYDQLPEGCKAVNIKGQQYYISQEGIYLQPIKENGKTLYEIVGLDSNSNNDTPQVQPGPVQGG